MYNVTYTLKSVIKVNYLFYIIVTLKYKNQNIKEKKPRR